MKIKKKNKNKKMFQFIFLFFIFICTLFMYVALNKKVTKDGLYYILWFIFFGITNCILDLVFGLILCITIIGIPVGIKLFKNTSFDLDPFHKELKTTSPSTLNTIGNAIWYFTVGFIISFSFYLFGLVWNIADAGKPIANQFFKLSDFYEAPLGKEFVENKRRRHHRSHQQQQYSSCYSETE